MYCVIHDGGKRRDALARQRRAKSAYEQRHRVASALLNVDSIKEIPEYYDGGGDDGGLLKAGQGKHPQLSDAIR